MYDVKIMAKIKEESCNNCGDEVKQTDNMAIIDKPSDTVWHYDCYDEDDGDM